MILSQRAEQTGGLGSARGVPPSASCVIFGESLNPGASVFYCVQRLNMFLKRMYENQVRTHGKVPLGASHMVNVTFIEGVLISVTN